MSFVNFKNGIQFNWNTFKGSLFLNFFLISTIVLVPFIFREFSRPQAAIIAAVLFLCSGYFSVRASLLGKKSYFLLITSLIFLVAFAIPIFYLRISNWGIDFNSLQIGQISGRTLHNYSTYSYALMLVASLYRTWVMKK